ncbi:MAG: ABC transporter permease subunit [Rhodospirillum sp.]|nr:ABC transporter permease subunit [Rhodospirillum sp.]MCF8489329.1 ABC transporter permease subunit [Rhodospirillum sp.]MCF8503225.1 ABC transporter permease subunit [Rhodospirillum sp.]
MERNHSLRLGLLALPGLVFLSLFFVLPLSVVAVEAFTDGGSAFVRLWASGAFWSSLTGSLILGTVAPLASLAVGFPVALCLAGLPPERRTTLMFVISLPLTFSGLIVAYGFILGFGRAGFVTLLLAELGADPAEVGALLYSPTGLAFAYSYYLIPRVVMVLVPVLVNFDRRQLRAAESLGASSWRAHWDILIPQILPAALSAYCLVAAVALGAYGTALALVGTQLPILPLQLFSMVSETGSDFPMAAALSIVLMALTSLVIALAEGMGRFGQR